MATAFDGLGLGMLGSERRYMSGDNILSDLLKGAKNAAFLGALHKSGVIDYLNNIDKPKAPAGAVPPAVPVASAPAAPAAPVVSADNESMPTIADDAAANVFNPNVVSSPVLKQINPETGNIPPKPLPAPGSVGVSPDLLKPRNPAEDQVALEYAAAPPPQMNLPQYGHQGGGINPISVISTLAKFLV